MVVWGACSSGPNGLRVLQCGCNKVQIREVLLQSATLPELMYDDRFLGLTLLSLLWVGLLWVGLLWVAVAPKIERTVPVALI